MGIIQSLEILDNGVPCPRDNMKPAVFVVLAFRGLCAAAPHPDSGYSKHKCQTTYKTVYETVYETACETSYKKECYGYGYDKKCKSVPVEKCHQVPKQIPKESCKDIPIQVPIKVPREVCDKIPRQITKEIPIHYCDYH